MWSYAGNMNMRNFLKSTAQLCVFVVLLTALLVPVQASITVPTPARKPLSGKLISEPKALNLVSLFTALNPIQGKIYPHGYEPLSSSQAKLYKKIFDLQLVGKFEAANVLISSLQDKRLLGHVLYQRYMHANYKTSYKELKIWLDRFSDHPDADKIYKLAMLRTPGNVNNLKQPEAQSILSEVREPTIAHALKYKSTRDRNAEEQEKIRALNAKMRSLLRAGETTEAATLFQDDAETKPLMDNVEQDMLQAQIAAGFLYQKRFESAYKLATKSVQRSGKYVPEAAWVAGLSLWQMDLKQDSVAYFEKVGKSKYASGWLSSAGYFWAARAHETTGKGKLYYAALKNAAKHKYTFYGIMASSLLNRAPNFNWDSPKYTTAQESLILANPAGRRAFDLVATGQYNLAEEELLRLKYAGNQDLKEAVLAYAVRTGLPRVAARLGNISPRKQGGYYTSALYPMSPWTPASGDYTLDPSLIHAIMRQESRFDQNAKSGSGAMGLMQVMPKTAKYVAKSNGYKNLPNAQTLTRAETNISIGQDYVSYLLRGSAVNGDVLSMLVAYNAGPGNLQKWQNNLSDIQDPLLFIEMMPIQETRDYVEHVLANYWIYRSREHRNLPSLAALAQGKPAKYALVVDQGQSYKLSAN